MNKSLHAPVSQLLLYGLGTLAGHSINLLLLPLISRRLEPHAYGMFSMALILFTLFGMILDFGVLQGFIKQSSETQKSESQKNIFTTTLISILTTATLLCVPFIFFSPTVAKLLFGSKSASHFVLAVTFGAWVSVFFQLILTYYRSTFAPLKHGIIALLRALFFGAFTLIFFSKMSDNLVALFSGWLLPYFLITLFLLPFLVIKNRGKFSFKIARKLFAYGLPIVPSYLILWFLTHTDVYLLRKLTTIENVGFYTLAAQVCFLLAPINTALQMGWLPFILRTVSKDPHHAPEHISRLWTMVFAVVGILALSLASFAPELIALLSTPAYAPAAAAIPLLSLSTLLYTLFLVFSGGIHIQGTTWKLPLITAGGAVINIILNILIIPRWGIIGAAATTVVSNAVLASTAAYIAHRSYPIPYVNELSIKAALILGTGASLCFFIPSGTLLGVTAKALVIMFCIRAIIHTGIMGRHLFADLRATLQELSS